MATTEQTRLHETGIDLPEHARATLVALLNTTLADLSDLKSQAKQAHWNVRGANFFQLHELFDKLAEELDPQIDDVAERIATLGGTAFGTVRAAAANSTIDEFPESLDSDLEFARVLAQRYAAVGSNLRAGIDRADELGDKDTADLYTGISRSVDKNTWFLDAHFRK